MALFFLEPFKGRTFKMESNYKQEDSFKEKRYPVDLPAGNYGELSIGYDEYLSSVHSRCAMPLTLPNGEKVEISKENIGRLLFLNDGDLSHFILALHKPEDETQVVAVFLHGKWWPVGDVLKTSNKSRCGLVLVDSLIERVVLFLLSQVIFGILEKTLEEDLYFSSYSLREHGKILWQNGEAVGFYTVKKKGSLCNGCTGLSYQLPVLDTVFVRSRWRRTGLALQMLEDFCSTQSSECILGISFPMSPGMYGVCKKYLEVHNEERDRLYEVEAPGEWAQRRNVWLNIQLRDLPKRCGNSEQSSHSSFSHEISNADLEGEGIPRHFGSSVKNTSRSGKKRPADQNNTGTALKKFRT